MKSTATATVYFEDGTEVTHANVTYSRWQDDYTMFCVQRYDPADETRLQTFVYKREHVKSTLREQDDSPQFNLTEMPK